ncbi:MAG: nucleoside-diphosphate kinase, partial [Planctomycetota bacterium]
MGATDPKKAAPGTIRADRWERLRAATAAHERARFGASAEEHTG